MLEIHEPQWDEDDVIIDEETMNMQVAAVVAHTLAISADIKKETLTVAEEDAIVIKEPITTQCNSKNVKIEDEEKEELLGSVTTRKYPGLRTSARVIKKQRQDQPRPTTPTHNQKEQQQRDTRTVQKTASQVRHNNKSLWSNLERNHFFDALHEFGKDFEAIGNYINGKLKRRCIADACFKTKEQVRIHYYQTFHKVCKYVKFSDEVKKPVQELYALINYGEMRRKLQFVPDKHLKKLKHLVYQGHTTVRCKGKNIRIKTPSCKALRRLNQLDDSLDDIKLPARIDVIVSPSSMMDFGRVQCIAQNPRVRTTVPMNKKLINLIKTFQYKWRSAEAKLAEEEPKLFVNHNHNNDAADNNNKIIENKESETTTTHNTTITTTPTTTSNNNSSNKNVTPTLPAPQLRDGEICFVPKPGATINRPLLSITEYLSSGNICLSAYEERMGVKLRGESLMLERPTTSGNCKRPRTDSGSDKRSPEIKKYKLLLQSPVVSASCSATPMPNTEAPIKEETTTESSGDELSDEINELLTMQINDEVPPIEPVPQQPIPLPPPPPPLPHALHTNDIPETRNNHHNKRNVGGAAASGSANNKSYKPLLDEQTIRRIHKGWTISTAGDITVGDLYVVLGSDARLELQYNWRQPNEILSSPFFEKQSGLPYNPQEIDNTDYVKNIANSSVSNRLKHLLLIANLSDRLRKKQCNCGHVCDRTGAKARTYVSPKVFVQNSSSAGGCGHENGIFRQPIAPPRRPTCNIDPVKQLNNLQLSKSQKLARQVLVQRMLLPTSGNQVQEANTDFRPSSTIATTTTTTQMVSTTSSSTSTHVPVLSSMPLLDMEAENMDSEIIPTTKPIITTTTTTTITTNEVPIEKTTTTTTSLLKIEPEAARTSFTGSIFSNTKLTNFNANNEEAASSASISANPTTTLQDSGIDDNSSTSSLFNSMMSPMHLIRDSSSNSRWLEENLNDFSLTSLLGHLDEITGSRDLLDSSCNMSVMSESSVDYRHKFQEATAMIHNQEQEQSLSK